VSTLVKQLALRSIAAGVQLPDASLGRFQELAYLKRLLEDLHVNCVIDVGANRGQFASEVRGIGFTSQIFSFEPIASEFAQLQAGFAGDAKWKGFQMALGDADGETELNVIPGLTVMSSILEPKSRWPGVHAETVQVRRLDGLWPQLEEDHERHSGDGLHAGDPRGPREEGAFVRGDRDRRVRVLR